MSIDVDRARRDTPGTANVAHLNNAGAALPPVQVTDAVIGHLRAEAATGGYEAAAAAVDRLDATYVHLARLVGCDPDEIAVVENATRAWDMAFYAMRFARGDRILTARAEYASNVIALLQVARARVRSWRSWRTTSTDRCPWTTCDDSGRPGRAGAACRHHPRAHRRWTRQPGRGDRRPYPRTGVLFLLDACQSLGQLPVDVRRSAATSSGRNRTQVPARPPRHRLPVRPAQPRPGAGTSVPGPARRHLDRAGRVPRSARTPAASRTGRPTTPARSASASPSATRSTWGWTPSRTG